MTPRCVLTPPAVLLNIKGVRTMRREGLEKEKYERFLFFEEERSFSAQALDKFVDSMWWYAEEHATNEH